MFQKLCLYFGAIVIAIAIGLEAFDALADRLGWLTSVISPANLAIVGFLICVLGLMDRVFKDTGSADYL